MEVHLYEISKILMEIMVLFKKNLKYTEEKETFVQEIIVKVKLLSFFKQTDQHICAKFAKNRYLKY